MESNLLKYIWKHSRRQQLIVLGVTLLFFPILYLTLELPKWIINDALNDSSLPKQILGQPIDAVTYLAILCLTLLLLVVTSGVLKMRLNTYKGVVGERLVRRLRYNLIQNTLRFPLPYFSRVSSGELISTVTAETEPLGGYIGEAVALPVFQGGTMITILIFMFMQDWVVGLISMALIPVQGYLIPRLQQQVNKLKKERVRRVRKLSERISETVAGATEIRLHGTQPYTLSEYSRRLGDLFLIRLEIFKKKYFMKFLNNTIGQITPFMFYLFGGYLVIKGDLTIGALVAAIAAYKDLTSPWRELLNYYQLHEDSKVKYQQIIELFSPPDLVEIDETESIDDRVPIKGDISMRLLSWRNENSETVLSGITLDITAGSMIAITGDYAVRRAKLAQILAGIEQPFSGGLLIDGKPMSEIPDSILRRRLTLQGPDPHMFVGTVVENMEYGLLQHEPEHIDDVQVQGQISEAFAAGNRAPLDDGWLDYRQAGQPSRSRSVDWLMQVTKATGSSKLIAERRLLEVFNPTDKPELARKLLLARAEIKSRLHKIEESSYISLFDPGEFNPNATIAENILFGVAADHRLNTTTFDVHPFIRTILDEQGLTQCAIDSGLVVAGYLLKTYDNRTLSTTDIDHFGFSDEDTIDLIRQTMENNKSGSRLSDSCNCLLTSLFLLIIPERHSFVKLIDELPAQVVNARNSFRKHLPQDLIDAVTYFNEDLYHPNLTVVDNLLFGRMSTGNPAAERIISKLVDDVIAEFELANPLSLLLGESQVGISGSRLPLIAKHRISLGRSLMKKPGILVLHDALGPMDEEEQRKIRSGIRELLPESTIIWIARDVDNHQEFDHVYAFTEAGPLIEVGLQGAVVPTTIPSDERAVRSSNAMDLIANSILFSELAPDHQRYIANHSRLITMSENSSIYESGDTADSAWLVVSGEVTTVRGSGENAMLAGRFTRPEVFGAMDVMADCPRLMSATTSKDSLLLRIDASAIESVALSDAKVSRTLLRSLSHQWRI
ncbi:MAG: cyclic nucleotide-binding domain-containing protein [Granulosicoccus sp.]|nr:cyclic nucleotide-binding domain-containing protein [Granulosicoccus sp.]